MTALLYAVLAASLWYLAAWSEITYPLMSKLPTWLDKLVTCASCFGFWAGSGVAAAGGWLVGWEYLGLPARGWTGPLTAGRVEHGRRTFRNPDAHLGLGARRQEAGASLVFHWFPTRCGRSP